MLPRIEDWLKASWSDYRRRWLPIMTVLALGGLATLAAVLAPLAPAGLAAYVGAGSPWVIWSAASMVSVLAGLWFSTWGQAAAIRAASNDERAGESLRLGWRQTPAFVWVLSLVMLAAGGGYVLLILPGLALTVLLFLAPYYQMSGEDRGMGAVELSFARVKPVFGAVCGRLLLVLVIVLVPGWIPYVGWLIGPLWAPFGLVACARLADDLKTLTPAPERPSLTAAVAVLGLIFVAASGLTTWSAGRAASAVYGSYMSGKLALKAPDQDTAQSLANVLRGTGTAEDASRSMTYMMSLSSGAVAR